jgi:hypothetical protein
MDETDLMNADYPIPDPAWDYSGIWHHAQEARQKLEKLLKYMADIEEATPESDRLLREQLESILTQIEGAIAFLPKS